jgi:hypothetical protein
MRIASWIHRDRRNVMLAGAVNTSIVGSNGVLNRVSETASCRTGFGTRIDASGRPPHSQPGRRPAIGDDSSQQETSSFWARHAFGVMWSFAMKEAAVLVLDSSSRGNASSSAAESQGGFDRRSVWRPSP